jgi:signal transduction histidine kinase/DNA-binding response OmpR family regulator
MEIRNSVIGNIVFLSADAPLVLTGKDMETLESFVRQTATAVNNARLYDRAEAAVLAKSDFLARMSHEIRSPLNAILGMGHMLAETPLNEEQSRYLDIMTNSGGLLLSVINGILDFSKLESERMELEAAPFDLISLLEDVRGILSGVSKKKGLDVRLSISPEVGRFVVGDPFKLTQVLINLGDNAIRFTDKGEVTVQVETTEKNEGENRVSFSLTDTGIGIPEENIAMIFDSFSQAESSITRRFGGTGLGLTISRKLVQLMGGALSVTSKKNLGSRFFFTIPLPEAGNMAGIGALNVDAAKAGLKSSYDIKDWATPPSWPDHPAPLSILLAEDIKTNILVVQNYLKSLPVSLDIAEDGLRAVDMFKTKPYDLVLMDIHMPRMDGFEAFRQIRLWEAEKGCGDARTPVVALSAQDIENRRNGNTLEFDGILLKPFEKKALVKTIRELTEGGTSPDKTAAALPFFDPSLTEIIRELKHEITEELATLENALRANDYSTLIRLSHGFKGAAGNCGLDGLSRRFKALHDHALAKDNSMVLCMLHSIRNDMDALDLQYRPW